MKRLLLFRIGCTLIFGVCAAALFIEIFVNDIDSLTAVYLWAGLALLSLSGMIAGTFVSLSKGEKKE